MISPTFIYIRAPNRLIVIKLTGLHYGHLSLLHLLVDPLCKRIDSRPHIICTLIKLRPCRLKLCGRPVHGRLLQVFDPILKHLLLFDQLGHVCVSVLTRVLLKYLQAYSQILVLILQHEYVGIEVIHVLSLLLDVLPQTQVALEHLLHHVHGVDDALGDRVLGLIHGTREGRGAPSCDVLEGLAFFSEKFLYVVFVFDDALSDDQSSLS
jgi:hypothetical protein